MCEGFWAQSQPPLPDAELSRALGDQLLTRKLAEIVMSYMRDSREHRVAPSGGLRPIPGSLLAFMNAVELWRCWVPCVFLPSSSVKTM